MDRKLFILFSAPILIIAVAISFAYKPGVAPTLPVEVPVTPTTSPTVQPTPREPAVSAYSGTKSCEVLYDEIEGDIKRSNFCKADTDCAPLVLGGWYIDFGCYHYINSYVDKNQILSKMSIYKDKLKCSTIINECQPTPEAKCVQNKCVAIEDTGISSD